jgi:hypothetical protein
MTYQTRSAYGLSTAADEHWSRRGLCKDAPDLWTSDRVRDHEYAMHVCGHCPVYGPCAAAAPTGQYLGAVVAGVFYDSRGTALAGWPAPVKACALCGGGPDRQPDPEQHGCDADRHDTIRAYQDHGCRCPEAVERMRAAWRRTNRAHAARQRLARAGVL